MYYYFFNDPATTWIYTYRHTLSLHDALPISLSLQWQFLPDNTVQPYVGVGLNYTHFFDTQTRGALAGSDLKLGDSWGLRSEEHTSELQSLMRTSYAVFCLKNKHTTYKPTAH